MCAVYLLTPPSPTPVTHFLVSSPAGGTDLAPRCSTPRFTLLHLSEHLALSRWCDAKPAETICRILLVSRPDVEPPASPGPDRCSPGAWRSLCFPWPAYRRSLVFLESS